MTNAEGKLLEEIIDCRRHILRFVRGPLPAKLPARELVDTPWMLLNMEYPVIEFGTSTGDAGSGLTQLKKRNP